MIQLSHLTKSYVTPKGRHYVFKDLNALLPENKSVAILGKNGVDTTGFFSIRTTSLSKNTCIFRGSTGFNR